MLVYAALNKTIEAEVGDVSVKHTHTHGHPTWFLELSARGPFWLLLQMCFGNEC